LRLADRHRHSQVAPQVAMTPRQIATFFRRLAAHDPAPQTELTYRSPYTLLVAVILSAQATDVGVNKATRELFKVAADPRAMVELGEAGLQQYIKSIGLYRNKARAIIAMSEMLLERYDGQVPGDRAALEGLPGVGRKTASVVLNAAFGQPTIAVDTHVFRVANRTGLAPGTTPREVEQKLEAAVPPKYARYAHHWLILHGRYVCKARRPECPRCPVADLCSYREKTATTALA
jgi:endonuclease-3